MKLMISDVITTWRHQFSYVRDLIVADRDVHALQDARQSVAVSPIWRLRNELATKLQRYLRCVDHVRHGTDERNSDRRE
jgi:hypothetical protein